MPHPNLLCSTWLQWCCLLQPYRTQMSYLAFPLFLSNYFIKGARSATNFHYKLLTAWTTTSHNLLNARVPFHSSSSKSIKSIITDLFFTSASVSFFNCECHNNWVFMTGCSATWISADVPYSAKVSFGLCLSPHMSQNPMANHRTFATLNNNRLPDSSLPPLSAFQRKIQFSAP